MIVTLAGRRIDDVRSGAVRFPLEQVGAVARRLRTLFQSLQARSLVCSAANGADLVALHVAGELGMRCHVVLPFSTTRFRRGSVTDRPGGELWRWIFDDVVSRARANHDLVLLNRRGKDDAAAFAAVNDRIITEALRIASQRRARLPAVESRASRGVRNEIVAVVVWEGRPKRKGDVTAAFADAARTAGLRVRSVRSNR